MKRGLIICVDGEAPEFWNDEHERGVKRSFLHLDAVEIITRHTGHCDVMYAWWALQLKGMTHIECRTGRFADHVDLRRTQRVIPLCAERVAP